MGYFHNPVHIHFGERCLENLPALLDGRTCVLLTSRGTINRGLVDRLYALCDGRISAIHAVEPIPTIASTIAAARNLAEVEADVILAVGGGSVLDTAKGLAAQEQPGLPDTWLSAHLREGEPFPNSFSPKSILAVPTTAGTGSEVTMWATIWGEKTGKKYSLSHEALYPEAAIVDPELTLTVPEVTTVATALDALSHSMEAIWNKNANPVSDALASHAISLVSLNLRSLLASPLDISLRATVHYASMVAGLAFSNTRTAIAHSISYPLTGKLGMPHGVACSFTLPEIMRINGKFEPERLELIVRALGCRSHTDAVDTVQCLLVDVGIAKYVKRYLKNEDEVDSFVGDFITLDRAGNNIASITQAEAERIFRKSAKQMLKS